MKPSLAGLIDVYTYIICGCYGDGMARTTNREGGVSCFRVGLA